MKVLVTGGAGFIGSHLAEALVKRHHQVTVLDSLIAGDPENLASIRKEIRFIKGDIRSEATLKKALRGVEVVFHQAALRSVPISVDKPLGYHEVNATAVLKLLHLSKQMKVRRVVAASSSSCYGLAPLPQKESMTPTPQSPYAATKLIGEHYCALFTDLYGLETVSLRYFNVFGPRQSLENEYAVVIPKFIAALLQGKQPPIHGDGKQSRDFTFVENVVQANLKAAMAPKRAAGQTYNVASGKPVSVYSLARKLARLIGVPEIQPKFGPTRQGDAKHSCGDPTKAKRLLNFKITVPFDAGLEITANWFDQNRHVWQTKKSR